MLNIDLQVDDLFVFIGISKNFRFPHPQLGEIVNPSLVIQMKENKKNNTSRNLDIVKQAVVQEIIRQKGDEV